MSQIVQMSEDALPLTHTFSENVYCREIFMPKGMIVIGHVHKTTHLNIVQTGKALVWMNGEVVEIKAPYTFESKAGTRKALYILEDMFWSTVHVTNETDFDKLDEMMIDKSASDNKNLELFNEAIDKLLIKKG